MMNSVRTGVIFGAFIAMAAGAGPARGQTPAGPPSDRDRSLRGVEAETPRWFYPRGERVDPVVPPPALYSGEGFPLLNVSAILFDPETPDESRALVQLGGANPIRRVVRTGDVVGGFGIYRIERNRVVVSIETLGASRLEVLSPTRGDAPGNER